MILRALTTALVVLSLLWPTEVAAQQAPAKLSDEASVSVLTVKPGDAIHSLFGHTAIRISDPAARFDVVFNYGTFDFGPDFLPRFVYGELDYFLSVWDFAGSMEQWRLEGRSVVEQVLDLTPDQAQRVYSFLALNSLPDNRIYRYDFFYDNCTTRCAQALRIALGEDLRATQPQGPERSFRDWLDIYLAHRPWLHAGMDSLMGTPADKLPQGYEALFIPDSFQESLESWGMVREGEDESERESSSLSHRALVKRTERLYESGNPDIAEEPVDSLFILTSLVWLAAFPFGRRRRFLGGLLLFSGIVGLFVCGFWFFTLHQVPKSNLNILWAWPIHVWPGILLLRNRLPVWMTAYLALTSLTCALVAAVWWWTPQHLPLAAFPIVLAMSFSALRVRVSPDSPDEPEQDGAPELAPPVRLPTDEALDAAAHPEPGTDFGANPQSLRGPGHDTDPEHTP